MVTRNGCEVAGSLSLATCLYEVRTLTEGTRGVREESGGLNGGETIESGKRRKGKKNNRSISRLSRPC